MSEQSAEHQRQVEYVLQTDARRGVRFIRLWFSDIQGFLKSVAISVAELENALAEGMTFDGSSIDGYARLGESDMVARPDPTTFQMVPWASAGDVARMMCDITYPDGTPFTGDPRHVLRKTLWDSQHLFYVGAEAEWYYFADDGPKPRGLDTGGYFDDTTNRQSRAARRRTIDYLEQLGIPVESAHHEVGPSQHEIILRYDDALSVADNFMTFRTAVREVALADGVYATFMPKPLEQHDGSGLHLHVSLFDGDENTFADSESETGLSATGASFAAGLLEHAPALTAITNQWVNSYKRLVDGFDAPAWADWGTANRSALVRVPPVKAGKLESTRLEYRSPDPACNPYLAFASLLAAGMDGITRGLTLDEARRVDEHHKSPRHRSDADIPPLPRTLDSALDALESDSVITAALGEHVTGWFLRNKRSEWDAYHSHVSRYELNRYLPRL